MALSREAALAAMSLLVLSGCKPDYSPDTYNAAAVQQANKVDQGVVVGVRAVGVQVAGATGAVAGAAVGGIAGSQLPGSNTTSALGAVGGSLIGGLLGSGVERATGDTQAFEYIVRKPNGDLISVTQSDKVPMALGQRVLVIAGNQARIVPDYTTALPEPPKEAAKDNVVKPGASVPSASPAPGAPTPGDPAHKEDAPKEGAPSDAPPSTSGVTSTPLAPPAATTPAPAPAPASTPTPLSPDPAPKPAPSAVLTPSEVPMPPHAIVPTLP